MSEEIKSRLRWCIEELALECATRSTTEAPEALNALSAALAATRSEAQQAGRPDIAEMAGTLKASLEDAARGTPGLARLDEILKGGIEQLQQALDRSAEPTPAAAKRLQANALLADVELVTEIVLESREHLSSLEGHLLTLEQNPGDREAVHAAFRSFHTIKGLAGFLELKAIQEVSHEVESVLDQARNDQLAITPEVIDIVLAGRDYLAKGFDAVERMCHGEAGTEPDNKTLVARIRRLADATFDIPVPPAPAESAPEPSAAPAPAVREEPERPGAPEDDKPRRGQTEARLVKVDTAKLDYLVDMVGEMVIAQSQIRHDPDLAGLGSPRLQRNLAQLNRTTSELQRTAMAMRMVPVGQLFRRMIRLVRDLSRKAGKKAELELVGEETELDRTIVEELSDPLIHMLRNSLDHGLEPPEERVASGKNACGKIRLRACHQAGHIQVEISDDGRGINKDKVLAKARSRGLVSSDSHLSDADVFNLIFEPGFSTADRVTDVSGRGVGMDVVRKQILKLRGRVEVQSQTGQGTTFVLKLPLTLAIIDGLVVNVGRERYIVPLFAVSEIFRPKPEMLSSIRGQDEMVLIRGRLLPVVRLHRRFGVRPRTEEPCQAIFIVAENGGRHFAMMVDEFTGKQEVVVKGLGETMKNIPGVAGGAILGDGRVGLVLDLDRIFDERRG